MAAYNQNLIKDAFYHLDQLRIKITKVKLAYNRERVIVSAMDDLLQDCDLLQIIIQSYDTHNFRHMCNVINDCFADRNSHGVHAIITKKRLGLNIDKGRLNLICFTV